MCKIYFALVDEARTLHDVVYYKFRRLQDDCFSFVTYVEYGSMYDSRATRRICRDKISFQLFAEINFSV